MANIPEEEFNRIISGIEIPPPEFDLNRYSSLEEQDFIESYHSRTKFLFHDYEDGVIETHIEGKVAYFEPVAFSTYGPICNLYQNGRQVAQVVVFGSLYKSPLMELKGLPPEIFGIIPSLATDESEVLKNIKDLPFIFTPYGFVYGGNLCYAQAETIDSLKTKKPTNSSNQGKAYGVFTLVDAFGNNTEELYAISHTIVIEDEPSDRINVISASHT